MLKRKQMRCVQGGILALCLFVLAVWNQFQFHDKDVDLSWDTSVKSRQLQSLPNCTPRAIGQFPHGLFTQTERAEGAIIIHMLTTVYMFVGFAFLCDDYFVPSLEVLCEVLNMDEDVAGATFMAAGSSAPELATAVIAVFIAKDDIGLGTVVGSAVYNVMFVISICALFAGTVVYLKWWPLFRDCVFYALSVAALAFVIMDEYVYWYEALSFLILYLLYIILMYFNKPLEYWIVPKVYCCKYQHAQTVQEMVVLYDRKKDNPSQELNRIDGVTSLEQHSEKDNFVNGVVELEESEEESEDDTSDLLVKNKKKVIAAEEPDSVFAVPNSWWKKILWVLALPLKILLFVTVPDCRRSRWRNCFFITFIMCLVWLSVFSYIMVWMITVIGYTVNIPDTIMGLTFVAFGVSLPDVIASLIVVREGKGDMAVSNAVGSNVFDILICLGVPWLLKTSIKAPRKPVQVYSGGLLYSTLTLLATVIFLLVATHLNGWRLTKKYGIVLMFVYIFFTVLTSLYELNVFGYFHPEECPT